MNDKLNNKRVFVTGADGFIGSHLVEHLVAAGAEVRALVFYNSWNSIGWLAAIPQATRAQVDIQFGDVRDDGRMRNLVRDCAYVFHLSSLIGIPYSYDAPRSYVDTNISGALNILEACRDADDLQRLVHVSTSEVYGTAQTVPITEGHPLVGQSPYSASKIAADKMAESFYLAFGLPVVIARPFNTYGPRQTARAVIPTIISQLLSDAPTLRLGALSPTRDFCFVRDTAAGMAALAASEEALGETVNIGTGQEWSIEQTAQLAMSVTGREKPIESEETRFRPKASEVNRLLADTSRLQRLTGWTPGIDLEAGLAETASWIFKNLDRFDPSRHAV